MAALRDIVLTGDFDLRGGGTYQVVDDFRTLSGRLAGTARN